MIANLVVIFLPYLSFVIAPFKKLNRKEKCLSNHIISNLIYIHTR